MSLQQAALEVGSVFHVVGTRANGEREMISEYVNVHVAQKVLSLMHDTGNFRDIFIEVDGKHVAEKVLSLMQGTRDDSDIFVDVDGKRLPLQRTSAQQQQVMGVEQHQLKLFA